MSAEADLANLLKICRDSTDNDRIVDALKRLQGLPMDLALLTSSKAGVIVNALKKCPDLRVTVLAKAIVDKWKGLITSPAGLGSSSAAASSAAASRGAGSLFEAGAGAGAAGAGGAGVGAGGSTAGPGVEPPGLAARHPYDQLHWRLTSAPPPPAGDVQAALGYGYDSAGSRCSADRVRELRKGASGGKGPVLLWMQRDQRVADNWALLRASDVAQSRGVPLALVFNLTPSYLGANVRAYGFMLRGLREVEAAASALGLPFLVTCGDPVVQLPALATALGAGLVVTDFSPLRIGRTWRTAVASSLPAGCGMEEVDAHNVVPAWRASDKVEVGARTIRKKIHAGVHKYGSPFPRVPVHTATLPAGVLEALPVYGGAGAGAGAGGVRLAPRTPEGRIAWGTLLPHLLIDFTVPEVAWAVPGEVGGRDVLSRFLTTRLKKYDDDRNNPNVTTAQSDLSPYLHFGQVSPHRVLLELRRVSGLTYAGLFPEGERKTPAAAFTEELVVRRELADNFCLFQPAYDSLQGASAWAQATLADHAGDKREATYSRAQFEAGATHEALWNAAQAELVARGKMHGFMRMYWAKKILEWAPSPAEALSTAIYLNDKYSLDGRDPNGYVGVAWAIAGVHDMGWAERPVFGKIRYMNLAGCKRKFDVARYVAAWPVRARPALPAPTAPGGVEAVAAAAAAGAH